MEQLYRTDESMHQEALLDNAMMRLQNMKINPGFPMVSKLFCTDVNT